MMQSVITSSLRLPNKDFHFFKIIHSVLGGFQYFMDTQTLNKKYYRLFLAGNNQW